MAPVAQETFDEKGQSKSANVASDELRKYRIALFRDASQMKKFPDRVPHVSAFDTWRQLAYGMKMDEPIYDYEKMEKVIRWFQEEYNFDSMTHFGTRNPFRVPKAFGESCYEFDPVAEVVNIKTFNFLEADQLDEFAKDYKKVEWETFMKVRFPEKWNENLKPEDLQAAVNESLAFTAYVQHIGKVMREEYGVPANYAYGNPPQFGIEYLWMYVRGMRNMMLDLRRCPEKIKACCEVLDKDGIYPFIEKIKNSTPGPDANTCFDVSQTWMCTNFFNRKQFEEFFWNIQKPLMDAFEEKDKSFRIMLQGSGSRFYDYLADFKRGFVTLQLEQDDARETRKTLPNVAIMGGIETRMLYNWDKDQIIDYAKALIDDIGMGLMLGQDKFAMYTNDAKKENVKALCDFIVNYRPY